MADYVTLINALPSLPTLDKCRQLPLSRIALERRLSMLSHHDSEQLALVEQLYFPHQGRAKQQSEQQLVQHWQQQLACIDSLQLQARVNYLLELWTLLAALRYRAAGQRSGEAFLGAGRWLGQIRRHWHESRFGLETLWPEVSGLCHAFDHAAPEQVERHLNRLLWQDLWRCEQQRLFDFDAVVCFVLRWGLAERQLSYQVQPALQRFQAHSCQLLASSEPLALWLKETRYA
ncbi:hypothetical protein ACFVYJ_13235 [Pontibacter sp. JAM-7]|uniref:hypothetical protein n=1 Tax=Pontibacter sp. JAM-7 TaxID=3366581 RepID=UPI003AF6AF44